MTLSYDDLTDLAGHRTITDVPCPLCGPGRRSPANRNRKVLRVWHTKPGFASYCCARCGERGYARADAARIEPRRCPVAVEATVAGAILPTQEDADQQARIEIALKSLAGIGVAADVSDNRGEPSFTLGWKYFVERRGLHIGLLDDLSHALRWHEGVGAIVGLMTDPISGEPCGIHRTFLNADGTKRERKMLGRQGVIRLSKDAGAQLGLTEGVEDGLAVLLSGFAPIWVATSAGAIKNFPIIAGVNHLTVFGDNDPDGRSAGQRVAYRYRFAHKRADLRFPDGAKDWADALTRTAA